MRLIFWDRFWLENIPFVSNDNSKWILFLTQFSFEIFLFQFAAFAYHV